MFGSSNSTRFPRGWDMSSHASIAEDMRRRLDKDNARFGCRRIECD